MNICACCSYVAHTCLDCFRPIYRILQNHVALRVCVSIVFFVYWHCVPTKGVLELHTRLFGKGLATKMVVFLSSGVWGFFAFFWSLSPDNNHDATEASSLCNPWLLANQESAQMPHNPKPQA